MKDKKLFPLARPPNHRVTMYLTTVPLGLSLVKKYHVLAERLGIPAHRLLIVALRDWANEKLKETE